MLRGVGLDDKLGIIAADRPADLAVFERHHTDPWENIATAAPSHVDLVLIGGDIAYGHHELVPGTDTSRLEKPGWNPGYGFGIGLAVRRWIGGAPTWVRWAR